MKKSGFTLIEALISLSILAVILSFIYLSFFTAFRAKSYVEHRNAIYQIGREILLHMQREITSAYLSVSPAGSISPYTYFVGISDEWKGNPLDKLYFDSLSHVNIPIANGILGSDYSAIGYDFKIDPDKTIVSMIRYETPFFTTAPLTQGPGFVVSDRVVSLTLLYFDSHVNQWTNQWDTRLSGRGYLPYAVLIEIILKDKSGAEIPFREIVHLRMAQ
ncbi:MAG: prepilin-type N-terminal cleavage/methylation domain-containing protein [Deltaproteobacteria bacterium]|nr:prepilin-type N-terminal cleavage/methylation domain-containing protein [Deltaproteobacteria bacterium]MCL5792787.1 prepilin-type N-terminal cleavage/methylation domain-containing protein [Deltaproteobacteria bacterium]